MSHFTLRRHYPTKVEYWVSEEPSDGPMTIDSKVATSGGPNTTNPLDWRVVIIVKFSAKRDDKEIAKGEIIYAGFFDSPSDLGEKDREVFMVAHGTSILYSAVRELVANLSARTPTNMVELPVAQFSEKNLRIRKEDRKQVQSAIV